MNHTRWEKHSAGSLVRKFVWNLLRWHRLLKLYRFWVHNSIIHRTYAVLYIHHPTSKLLPSLCNRPLPSTLPQPLYLLESSHCCLCLWGWFFYFCLVPSQFSPRPSPWTTVSWFFVSRSLFLFCLLAYFVHYSLYISEIIWYLSFSDLLVSLSIILSRSIHAVKKGKISFLYSLVCHCVNVPQIFYPLICRWTPGLLSNLDYRK